MDITEFDFDDLLKEIDNFENDVAAICTAKDLISSDQSVSNSSDAITKTKKKRARKDISVEATTQNMIQQNFKLTRPRIIKSDFRRSYASHWVNVFNSCNYDLLMDHVNQFYDLDMRISQRDLRPGGASEGEEAPYLVGRHHFAELWYSSMHLAPDQVCSIKHTYLKVRSDGTSTIKCCFQVQGTRLLSVLDEKDLQQGNMKLLPPEQQKRSTQDMSSTAAAVAAVYPAKVRSVIASDQRNKKWKERCTNKIRAETSLNDIPATNIQEGGLAQKECEDHTSKEDSTEEDIVDFLSCQFEELSDRDSIGVQEHHATSSGSAKKRRASKKVREVDEWISVAQEAHKNGSLDYGSDLFASTRSVASPGVGLAESESTLDWRPLHPPAHVAHLSTSPRPAKLGCPLKRSTEARLVSRANAVSPVLPHADTLTYLQAENERVMQECQLYSTSCQGQVVLMTKLDTICSFEMEFNADGKVTSLILNYIT